MTTPRSYASDATFTPSSLLCTNGTSVPDSVQSLIIQSEVECNELLCRLSFEEFKLLQIVGSLFASDINIDVENLEILQGGEISGTEGGYVAKEGPSPGYLDYIPYSMGSVIAAFGASYGGVGGYSNYNNSEDPYGIEEKPMDFGSGGTHSSGGGRINIMAAVQVTVDGIISENGGDCIYSTKCASASGGSIYIASDSVQGSGCITANGGAVPKMSLEDSYVATGAGGRIAIISNTRSPALTIEVAGGAISDQLPDHSQGNQGSFHEACLSAICYHGGKKTDECRCECKAPWLGRNCSICPLECKNGGLLKDDCSCSCKPEWTGNDCSKCNDEVLCKSHGRCSVNEQSNFTSSSGPTFSCTCNANYFGEKCETYCNPSMTCRGKGICSEDGKSCECEAGKVGKDCSCNATNCTSSTACSGNGKCLNSMCFCTYGFLGCDCSIKCLPLENCTSHGSCNRDGTCKCDAGFRGSNCAEQEITTYCSNPSSTKSGYPCLPLINDKLGYGINAIDGKTTIPVLGVLFTQGRTKTILGQNYELPDNVDCEAVTSSDVSFSTQEYRTMSSYQNELLEELGVSAARQGVYMSASTEYAKVKEEVLEQKKAVFKSDLVHASFVCRFRDQANSALSSNVENAMSALEGDRLVENTGTHYIHEVTIGGRISVLNFVKSCVFETLSTSQVQKRIESSVYTLATATESYGKFGVIGGESNSENFECDLFSLNTNFEKIVVGGKRELLTNPYAESAQDLKGWFDSLAQFPGIVQMSVKDIALLVPSITEDVDAYINGVQMQEEGGIDTNNTGLTECLPQYCNSVVPPPPPPPPPDYWVIVAVVEGVVLAVITFCLFCFWLQHEPHPRQNTKD